VVGCACAEQLSAHRGNARVRHGAGWALGRCGARGGTWLRRSRWRRHLAAANKNVTARYLWQMVPVVVVALVGYPTAAAALMLLWLAQSV
jgi:hypothetical protein